MTDRVLIDIKDNVAVITLNRPEQKNAMDVAMLKDLEAAAKQVGDARAVVITGAGRAFSSGADFTAMAELIGKTGLDGPLGMHGAIHAFYDALRAINNIPVPTIAAVNGAAVGAGLGLALLCDIRVVSESAKIGATFSRLGIHPGLGITARLPSVIGYEAAAELLFTGKITTGAELAKLGFARYSVPKDAVLTKSTEIATSIAQAAPLAVRQIKKTLRQVCRPDEQAVLEIEAFAQAVLAQTKDAQEGISASMSRREPKFEGH